MRQGKRYVRIAAFVVLTVLTALLQNTFLPAAGARHTAWLLLALVTAVAMHEPELNASLYGMLAGFLWDLASPLPDGVIALLMTVYACACSLLARWLFRQTILTAAVFCGAGSFACGLLTLLFHYLPKDFSAIPGVTFLHVLPSLLLTAPALPVFFFLIRAIEKLTGVKAGKPL